MQETQGEAMNPYPFLEQIIWMGNLATTDDQFQQTFPLDILLQLLMKSPLSVHYSLNIEKQMV